MRFLHLTEPSILAWQRCALANSRSAFPAAFLPLPLTLPDMAGPLPSALAAAQQLPPLNSARQ
jgi:hypothetical protein